MAFSRRDSCRDRSAPAAASDRRRRRGRGDRGIEANGGCPAPARPRPESPHNRLRTTASASGSLNPDVGFLARFRQFTIFGGKGEREMTTQQKLGSWVVPQHEQMIVI